MNVIYMFVLAVHLVHCKRKEKILPLFQIVTFPNDACTGGSRNGTCYTTEECSNRGGTNDGSCAEGYGVCCTFTNGCGGNSNENCTYFEVTGASDGQCKSRVCKCNSNICQMRLDFSSFVISGPSTDTNSIGKILAGQVTDGSTGVEYGTSGKCITDVFTVSGTMGVPPLCGDISGEHIYFDATNDCHDLNFSFLQNGNINPDSGTKESNRRFSIKVTQLECDSCNLAPPGCLQYLTNNGGAGTIKTFNYDKGPHLANQEQTICFRREQGNCRICFTASKTDVQVSGMTDGGAKLKGESCCNYGPNGMVDSGPYDCLLIPGAEKAADGMKLGKGYCQGGNGGGLASLMSDASNPTTICSRQQPFSISFISDMYEIAKSATKEGPGKGAKIEYFQKACP